MIGKSSKAIKIFFSYAHEDRDLYDELEKHLDALKDSGQITTWYDREIQPGTVWKREIEKRLDSADIILLLVSPDFMASEYCYGIEMKRALERHERGEVRVIPVILRPVFLPGTSLEKLKPLPPGGKAITVWPNRDEAFANITSGIYDVVKTLLAVKGEEEQAFLPGSTSLVTSTGSQPPLQPKIYLSRRAVLIGLVGAFVLGGSISWLVRPQVIKEPFPTFRSTGTPIPLGTTLYTYTGHQGVISEVAWSPTKQRIASASNDTTVQVWDAYTGGHVRIYRGHLDAVLTVAWSPDGTRIASGGGNFVKGNGDNSVQVWDAASGSRFLSYMDHSDLVQTLAWSHDGKRIASGSRDGLVKVWDPTNGRTILTYQVDFLPVYTLAWSPNGSRIASGSNAIGGKLEEWNATTGKTVLTYHSHPSGVFAIAWSPDGKYIASGADDLEVWDPATGKTVLTNTSHGFGVYAIKWSSDSKRIASGGRDNTAQVWNVATGNIFSYAHHTDTVTAVSWSPDGMRVASGSGDKTVQVWQAS